MKKRLIIIMILCLALLCGCSMGVELDSQQNNLIAEYAAGVLIKHSYNHSNRYEFSASEDDTEEPTQEQETTQPEEPTSEPEKPTDEDTTQPEETTSESQEGTTSDDGNGQEGTTSEQEELRLEEVLGLENVSLECTGYEVTDSLDADPEGFFVLNSETGYKFVVANYTLINMSEETATVNTADKNVIFKGTFNDVYKYNNYDASILKNDLTVLKDVSIEAGAEYKTVIIFMVPEDVADSIESFVMTVASDENIEGVYTIK